MGVEYYFYLQKQTDEGWIVPPDFTTRYESGASIGEVTWIDDRDVTAKLFWGKQAIFTIHRESPPDCNDTALFRFYCSNGILHEGYSGWIPVEELLLDYWNETYILVSRRTLAKYAPYFGDGKQPFPCRKLEDAGMPMREIEILANTSYYAFKANIADKPIDWTYGKPSALLAQLEPDHIVEVTWHETLASFMGNERTEDFLSVRRYGKEEELRLICILS